VDLSDSGTAQVAYAAGCRDEDAVDITILAQAPVLEM
jgi:hypothetical protein